MEFTHQRWRFANEGGAHMFCVSHMFELCDVSIQDGDPAR